LRKERGEGTSLLEFTYHLPLHIISARDQSGGADRGKGDDPLKARQQTTRTGASRIALAVVAMLFLSIQFAIGAHGLWSALRIGFRDAPLDVLGPAFRKRLEFVQTRNRTAQPLFLLLERPDAWYAGLWHRALYPVPVFVIDGADILRSPRYRILRSKGDVRLAVAVGTPPLKAGFRPIAQLPPEPGAPEAWFGEVVP
jgi:hypothetical protein